MKHAIVLMSCLLLVVLTDPTQARAPNESAAPPDMVEIVGPSDLITTNPTSTADKTDYYLLYSEDFESGEGGWTSHDLTAPESHWQISDFNAANLDPTPGNHAWWCGADFTPCDPGDEPGGYGQLWDDRLVWTPFPGIPAELRVTATVNIELEGGYDYLYLEFWNGSSWQPAATWDGFHEGLLVDVTIDLSIFPIDHVGLRWHVTSDGGYDSTDCMFINDGAAQIDNIVVWYDTSPVSTETCEPGDPSSWVATDKPGVGDFAQLWDDAWDADPCDENANHSHRWVFVDDGDVVSGTGGYAGTTGNDYFEGGWVVNPEGGLLGPGNAIWNEVRSPEIPWVGAGNGCKVAFDLFMHVPFGAPEFTGVHATHTVRFKDASGDWSGWTNPSNYWYIGGPYNRRFEFDVSHLVVPDCTHVQVALGVGQFLHFMTGTAGANPSPYFDNVEVTRYDAPFNISADQKDLAQDAFPESGLVPSDPVQDSIRFDSARNLRDPADSIVDFGDSLVVAFVPLDGTIPVPALRYMIHPNPVYNPYRSMTGDTDFAGSFEAGSTTTSGGVTGTFTNEGNNYSFDLPDRGFLYPGDVMHYYFVTGITTLPEDLTGLDDFSSTTPYPETFTFRALPSVNASGEVPRVLLWNDSGLVNAANDWPEAMIATGLFPGVGFDTYRTTAPGHNQKNGLGHVYTGNLARYETIVYAGGNYSWEPLEDYDIQNLSDFFEAGEKSLIMAGNHTVSQLETSSEGYAFTTSVLGVRSILSDVSSSTLTRDQSVFALAGNPVFDDGDSWLVGGSCPYAATFDAVTLYGAEPLAEFAPVGTVPYTAASRNVNVSYNSTAFVFPYDLNFTSDVAKAGEKNFMLMSSVLEDVFISLDYGAVPCFLQTCNFTVADGTVEASWLVSSAALTEDFRLEAAGPDGARIVPHTRSSEDQFTALDDSPLVRAGGTIAYTLYYRNASDNWYAIHDAEVKVGAAVPFVTQLVGAFPNPFNPQTEIAFSLDRKQTVEVSVYDLSGRQIVTLVNDTWDAGPHTVVWKGTDATGRRASSGTYFVQMRTANKVESEKIMLVK